jgi:Predicted membrane protein
MKYPRKLFSVLRRAAKEFLSDNGMKLSASLSYYTLFSIGPFLIIIISFAGIFFGQDAVRGSLYRQLQGMVGHDAAVQVQNIIANVQQTDGGVMGAIVGIAILMLGATGVFNEIQSSINFIWSIRAKPNKGWLKLLRNRLISFSLVISCGFILLVSRVISALMDVLSDRLLLYFPNATVVLVKIFNYVLLFLVTGLLFAVIFKVLPDASIRWKDIFFGAAFTALLFMIGKFLIGFYLGNSHVRSTYGTAASLIILLLWVYYSSIILYFGAEFTKVYAIQNGAGIRPRKTAVFIVKQEVKEVESKDRL